MDKDMFKLKDYQAKLTDFKCKAQAPSNIALIKYWGKHGIQLPKNPSVSLTLSTCRTDTEIEFFRKEVSDEALSLSVFYEGKVADHFRPKILQFFERIVDYMPFLKQYHVKINTSNSFPHSSGIASSASGMAAIAMGLIHFEKQLSVTQASEAYYRNKASFLARLGSGSAARSLEGPLMLWGKHRVYSHSDDHYAVQLNKDIAPVFKSYQDIILIVDEGQKKVSSSAGHNLMNGHPYAKERFRQAHERINKLKEILENGDLKEFIKISESEALTLHAMMLTSDPYYLLMKPNTVTIIEKVWSFRANTRSNLSFTLDAGANVHLLFPKDDAVAVREFVDHELTEFCHNGRYIQDEVGYGASVLS